MAFGLMRGTIHRCTKFNHEMYVTHGLIKVRLGLSAEGQPGWPVSLFSTCSSPGSRDKGSPGGSREARQTPGPCIPEARGHPTPGGLVASPGTPSIAPLPQAQLAQACSPTQRPPPCPQGGTPLCTSLLGAHLAQVHVCISPPQGPHLCPARSLLFCTSDTSTLVQPALLQAWARAAQVGRLSDTCPSALDPSASPHDLLRKRFPSLEPRAVPDTARCDPQTNTQHTGVPPTVPLHRAPTNCSATSRTWKRTWRNCRRCARTWHRASAPRRPGRTWTIRWCACASASTARACAPRRLRASPARRTWRHTHSSLSTVPRPSRTPSSSTSAR